jgi:hypothetical protein
MRRPESVGESEASHESEKGRGTNRTASIVAPFGIYRQEIIAEGFSGTSVPVRREERAEIEVRMMTPPADSNRERRYNDSCVVQRRKGGNKSLTILECRWLA